MMLTLEDIELLFSRHGSAQYSGEPVTQLEHALQTAYLAEQSEASDALVTACLLHDLGHLLYFAAPTPASVEQGETPTLRGIDDTHQYLALPFLRGLLPDAVLDPIKLHVDAKRYLCRANDGYWAKLSDDSKRSLELQGGVFEPAQAAAFLLQPGARDAVMLRQWDDLAKQADWRTPTLAHFISRAARCASTSTSTT
ncbi:MAG: phosphonate degradation HD-domain oxygenase [Caldimonas sp.]